MTLASLPAQQLVFFLLAAYGFSWVLGYSHITLRARLWLARRHIRIPLTLIECPGCLGWWLGLGYGSGFGLPVQDVVCLAFATTASNMILHALVTSNDDVGDEDTQP